jgi:hypothetical protein
MRQNSHNIFPITKDEVLKSRKVFFKKKATRKASEQVRENKRNKKLSFPVFETRTP